MGGSISVPMKGMRVRLAASVARAIPTVIKRWSVLHATSRPYFSTNLFRIFPCRAPSASRGFKSTKRQGTTVTEVKSDSSMEYVMVSATCLNISLASPAINKMGKKTETVVKVEAMTASPTALVPAAAALRGSMPAARQVKMLSKMTMELSTIIPTAMTSPASGDDV
jgi:hypothetical protein